MESGRPTIDTGRHLGGVTETIDEDGAVQQRLASLLDANAEIEYQRSIFRTDRERIEASLMTRPIDSRKAFACFGFMIGTMPPSAIAMRLVTEGGSSDPSGYLLFTLLLLAGVATGSVGYLTGKYIPAAIAGVRGFSFPNRIAMFSLIGFTWGAISGAAGGLFLLVIGAIFAGLVGGVVGAISVPILVLIHDALRRGDAIEIKHFLPVAFGITLSLCAFILGL